MSDLRPPSFVPSFSRTDHEEEEEEEVDDLDSSFSRTIWSSAAGRHVWIVDDFKDLLTRADDKTVRVGTLLSRCDRS